MAVVAGHLAAGQLAPPDSVVAAANKRYEQLITQMIQLHTLGNYQGSLAKAKEIEALVRSVFGDSSLSMANVWHGVYSPIYVALKDYVMVYKVNGAARQVLWRLGDTLHYQYLGALNELRKVCLLLNPPLEQESRMLGAEFARLSALSPYPAQRVVAYLQLARQMIDNDDEPTARRYLVLAAGIMDTLTSFEVDPRLRKNQYRELLEADYAACFAAYFVRTGHLKPAMQWSDRCLYWSRLLTGINRTKLYEYSLARAAQHLQAFQFDDSKKYIDTVLDRPDLRHLRVLDQKAHALMGFIKLSQLSSDSLLANQLQLQPLLGGFSEYPETNILFALIDLMTNRSLVSTEQAKQRLAAIKKRIATQPYPIKFIAAVASMAEVFISTRAGNKQDALEAALQVAEQNLQLTMAMLPVMSEAEQRRTLAFYNIAVSTPFRILDAGQANGNQLERLLHLQLIRKSMVLRNWRQVQQAAGHSSDTAQRQLRQQWAALRMAAMRTASMGGRPAEVDSLRALADRAEAALGEQMVPLWPTPSALQQAIAKLPPQEVQIEFVRVEGKRADFTDSSFYQALVFGSRQPPVLVSLCSEDVLQRALGFRPQQPANLPALVPRWYPAKKGTPSRLYQLLWQPLQPYLQQARAVQLSKAGLLHQVAFGALWDGNHYLQSRLPLSEAFSLLEAWQLPVHMPLPPTAHLWGNVDYGEATSHAPALQYSATALLQPGSYQSAERRQALVTLAAADVAGLQRRLKAQQVRVYVHSRQAATEDRFKQLADSMAGVLHISTHGFYRPAKAQRLLANLSFFEDPLAHSALAMAGANVYWLTGQPPARQADDGLLTAYELAALNLRNVQVATLSACETALGEPTGEEGTLGLVRSLKMAGVQKVLASLWPVPAKATNELMLAFYTLWKKLGSPSAALRQAQLDLAARGYPPFYWAGWVLVD
jgi:CHAT domain-containing protein